MIAKRQTLDLLLLGIAIAIGLVRFVGLGSESLWLDEAKGASFAFSPLSEWWTSLPDHQAPPGHFLIVKWVAEFSRSEWALRLPSAVAGWLALLLTYSIAKRLNLGLPGMPVLFLACAPFFFDFSREARCYTFWVLAELAAWSALLRWEDSPDDNNNAPVAGLILFLPLLIHYYAIWFLLPKVVLAFVLLRKVGGKLKGSFLVGATISSLLAFPWLLHQVASMPPPNPEVITEFSEIGIGMFTRKVGELFGFEYPLRPIGWVLLLGAMSGAAASLTVNRKRVGSVCFYSTLLVPPLLIVVTTLLSDRYLATRHLIPILPVAWIAFSELFAVAGNRFGGFGKFGGVAAVVLVCGFGFFECLKTFGQVDRPPWREIAAYLEEIDPTR